jgi:uncharacterized protein
VAGDRQATIIDIRVIPRSGRPGISGTRDGAWVVRLNTPPVEGAANAELVDVLADTLGLPRRCVAIVAGERSRHKRVRVAGLDSATVDARLKAAQQR